MEHVPCDLCGTDDYEVLWDKTVREKAGFLKGLVIRDAEGNIIQGRTVICKRCGLVYANPRMSRKDLDHFYTYDYRKIYHCNLSISQERHAKNACLVLEQVFAEIPKPFLDIGCGTGQLVRAIGGVGIEPCEEHCVAAAKEGLVVFNTTVEVFQPAEKFRLISMLNSLEHVLSPTAVLSKIRTLLDDEGFLLLSVPNLYNTTIRIALDGFLSNAHLYHFSDDSLTKMLEKCGFQVINRWVVVEEIGDKLYYLCQRGTPREPRPVNGIVDYTKDYLRRVDRAQELKQEIARLGFR